MRASFLGEMVAVWVAREGSARTIAGLRLRVRAIAEAERKVFNMIEKSN
jgi:hypothetical protein